MLACVRPSSYLPVRRRIKLAEVGLEFPRENLECCRFANTIRSNESEHESCSGRGQPVQLEGVRSISMRRFLVEILRQVDDLYCFERTLLHADTAADTQRLAEEGDFIGGLHFDAQLANLHHRAALLALLSTLLRLASVGIHNGDAREFFFIAVIRIDAFILALLRHECAPPSPSSCSSSSSCSCSCSCGVGCSLWSGLALEEEGRARPPWSSTRERL